MCIIMFEAALSVICCLASQASTAFAMALSEPALTQSRSVEEISFVLEISTVSTAGVLDEGGECLQADFFLAS